MRYRGQHPDSPVEDRAAGAAMLLVLVAVLVAATGGFVACSLGGVLLGAGLSLSGRHD